MATLHQASEAQSEARLCAFLMEQGGSELGFRRCDLDTVAISERRIFLREGVVLGWC